MWVLASRQTCFSFAGTSVARRLVQRIFIVDVAQYLRFSPPLRGGEGGSAPAPVAGALAQGVCGPLGPLWRA